MRLQKVDIKQQTVAEFAETTCEKFLAFKPDNRSRKKLFGGMPQEMFLHKAIIDGVKVESCAKGNELVIKSINPADHIGLENRIEVFSGMPIAQRFKLFLNANELIEQVEYQAEYAMFLTEIGHKGSPGKNMPLIRMQQ